MGLFDAITGAVTATNNIGMQFLENRWNRMAATKAYRRDVEMWNRTNEYNSPAAQMQRYIDAGLNPMLIYGNGSSSAGNATNSVHASVPRMQAPQIDLSPIVQLMNLSKDMKLKDQDLANKQALNSKIKNDSDLTFAKSLTEDMRRILTGAQAGGVYLDSRLKGDLLESQVELMREKIRGQYLENTNKFNLNSLFPYQQQNINLRNKLNQQLLENRSIFYPLQNENYSVRNSLLNTQDRINKALEPYGLSGKDSGWWKMYGRGINSVNAAGGQLEDLLKAYFMSIF